MSLWGNRSRNKYKKIDKVLRCNCSICKRKGAIMAMVKNEDFKITKRGSLFKSI